MDRPGTNSLMRYAPEPSGFSSVVAEISRLRPSLSLPRHPMLRQYRELAHDLWKFTIARRIEGKLYIAITAFFGLHHMTVIGRILRVIFFERVERENHILWRYRLSVLPFLLPPPKKNHVI